VLFGEHLLELPPNRLSRSGLAPRDAGLARRSPWEPGGIEQERCDDVVLVSGCYDLQDESAIRSFGHRAVPLCAGPRVRHYRRAVAG